MAEKKVICPNCKNTFVVNLKIGERELLDGYHGECPKRCGFWYFEPKPEKVS